MDRIIEFASQPNATDASVLGNADGKLPASPITWTLDDRDTNLYFSTLLGTPCPCASHGAVVGLLALPARQIQQLSESLSKKSTKTSAPGNSTQENDSKIHPENILSLYLTAVSVHMVSLIYSWNSFFIDVSTTSSVSTARLIVEIVKATASAAHLCQKNRSLITTSGILSSLATLLTCIATDKTVPEGNDPSSSWKPSLQSTNAAITSLMQPNGQLTPFHAEFLQCCISAGQYRFAERFVREHPILAISPCVSLLCTSISGGAASDSSIIPSELFLRYHYYLGIVYLGCDSYQDAKVAFHMCVTLPGEKMSEIAIAARKKMILLNCLNLFGDDDFLQGQYVMMDAKFDISDVSPDVTAINTTEGFKQKIQSTRLSKHLLSIPDGTPLTLHKLFDRVSHQYSSSNAKNLETATSALEIQDNPEQESILDESEEPMMNPEDVAAAPSTKTSMTHESSAGESLSDYFGLLSYEDLVHVFASGNISLLKIKLELYNTLFVNDGNMGLIQRLIPALQYLLLIRASHVYQVMPLKRLARFLDLEVQGSDRVQSVETWLMSLTMKTKEILPFRLDFEKEIISFGSANTSDGYVDSSKVIACRIESCIGLAERISKLDIAITTSVKYQHALLKEDAALKQTAEEGGRSVKDVPV